jgi:DNA/RNA-binding protein KIN17
METPVCYARIYILSYASNFRPLAVENPFKMPSLKDKNPDKPGTSQKDKMPKSGGKRKSALDEIMEFEEQKKEKVNRKDYWLHEDIVVKVISKKLGDKYYKQKAYVKVCILD